MQGAKAGARLAGASGAFAEGCVRGEERVVQHLAAERAAAGGGGVRAGLEEESGGSKLRGRRGARGREAHVKPSDSLTSAVTSHSQLVQYGMAAAWAVGAKRCSLRSATAKRAAKGAANAAETSWARGDRPLEVAPGR
jgi:hypothetical protein